MSDSLAKYEPFLAMLELDKDVGPLEAERMAERCFHCQAWLVKDLSTFEYKELLLGDALELKKSELMITVPDAMTNADTRKAWVITQQSCKEAREKYQKAKTQAEYLKRLMRLMENASDYYGRKSRR